MPFVSSYPSVQIVSLPRLSSCIWAVRFLRHYCCVRRSAYHQATLPMNSHQQTTSGSMMLYQLLTTGSTGRAPRNPPARSNGASAPADGPDPDVFFFSFTKLGLILTYFYVCDRTNYFMKENK